MKRALALMLLFATPGLFAESPGSAPVIIRLDPRLDTIVPRDARIEKIADGFAWTEGPVWDRASTSLLFSDVPNNSIRQWRPGAGTSDFLKPSGYFGTAPFPGREPGSNGLAFDQRGRLVFAQHGERSISRREPDGSITKLVESYQGKRLNSPNDLVFASNGDLYFTDPPFGLPKAFDDLGKELPFQGVYRFSKSGQLALLTAEVGAPNGIAFSPDEKTLYRSDSRTARWLAFPVEPDGTLSTPRVLFDAAEFGSG
jgi:gluconolactonase